MLGKWVQRRSGNFGAGHSSEKAQNPDHLLLLGRVGI